MVATDWTALLARWLDAGLIDESTAARIKAFEADVARDGSARLRWPAILALAFGGLMLAGGVLLWVSAHWDVQSPGQRFALVLGLVAVFHLAGALAAERFQVLSVTFHAVGTVALGAGIFLAGQIFNLDEHWPGGIMLWAAGAVIAWAALGQVAQMLFTAVLGPAWLAAEWIAAHGDRFGASSAHVLATGTFLLALTYFTAIRSGSTATARRALTWLGGFALVPASGVLAAVTAFETRPDQQTSGLALYLLGWSVAIGLPFFVSALLRQRDVWPIGIAAAWVLLLPQLRTTAGTSTLPLYPWWAMTSLGLVAWGVRDRRSERVDMGAALFAATVLAFYFSHVMDRLERSVSLVGLGVLFLAGGWLLERTRRRLVRRARGSE